MAQEFTSTPMTPEQQDQVTKAARIFTNTMVTVVRQQLPNGSAPDKLQLMTTMAIQSVTTGAALAFDDAASAGLDADLFEALLLGMASAIGMKLGALDPFTREHAMRTVLHGMHGAIAHAAATNSAEGRQH